MVTLIFLIMYAMSFQHNAMHVMSDKDKNDSREQMEGPETKPVLVRSLS